MTTRARKLDAVSESTCDEQKPLYLANVGVLKPTEATLSEGQSETWHYKKLAHAGGKRRQTQRSECGSATMKSRCGKIPSRSPCALEWSIAANQPNHLLRSGTKAGITGNSVHNKACRPFVLNPCAPDREPCSSLRIVRNI
jgi:hypothetical protein